MWDLGDWLAHSNGNGWAGVPFARTAGCGRIVTAESGKVQVRTKPGDHGTVAYASGVQVCGSVWNCPACEAKIKTRRGVELAVAGGRHVEAGGTIGILTLTLRHQRAHALVDLVDGLNAAWRSLQQSKAWRDVRKPGGVVRLHTVKSLEVTRGDNGWHPHLHILVLAENDAALDAVHEIAAAKWAQRVTSRLGAWCTPSDDHGVNMVKAPAGDKGAARTLARYVSKFTAEVTRSDVKGSSALGSLLDGVESHDPVAIAEYLEWCRAMHGRRAVVFSRGLRALYLFDVEERTDEEMAKDLEDGQVAAEVPRTYWLWLCRRGLVPVILEAVERGEIPPQLRPPDDTPVRAPNRYVRRHRDRQTYGPTAPGRRFADAVTGCQARLDAEAAGW